MEWTWSICIFCGTDNSDSEGQQNTRRDEDDNQLTSTVRLTYLTYLLIWRSLILAYITRVV